MKAPAMVSPIGDCYISTVRGTRYRRRDLKQQLSFLLGGMCINLLYHFILRPCIKKRRLHVPCGLLFCDGISYGIGNPVAGYLLMSVRGMLAPNLSLIA
jgi:hypothetical protein